MHIQLLEICYDSFFSMEENCYLNRKDFLKKIGVMDYFEALRLKIP